MERDAEQGSNGVAGYQIPLSETSPLDNGHYIHDSSVAPVGVNFFQTSELENETYPTTSQGLPTTGISFLQESELGTSQPHEDYTVDERAEQIDDLQPSPQMPPQQSLTDTPEPPKVNLGASAYLAIETGDAGNAASEKMLSKPTSQVWSTVETKTDWAEEASPTTETAPVLAEKNQNEEWTTQASKHSRHQSQQQRGRGTGQRGRGAYRGEARGGTRGAYRGRGGDRGASNGERRGSYRGGERGRGRGASNPPPTAV